MICKHCGTEIDTRYREADGSVVCPGCGTVYRPRAARPEQSAPNTRRSTERTASGSRTPEIYGVVVEPKMTSDYWGPVPIVLTFPEEFSPNYPEGRFKPEYESNTYLYFGGANFKANMDVSAYGDTARKISIRFAD